MPIKEPSGANNETTVWTAMQDVGYRTCWQVVEVELADDVVAAGYRSIALREQHRTARGEAGPRHVLHNKS